MLLNSDCNSLAASAEIPVAWDKAAMFLLPFKIEAPIASKVNWEALAIVNTSWKLPASKSASVPDLSISLANFVILSPANSKIDLFLAAAFCCLFIFFKDSSWSSICSSNCFVVALSNGIPFLLAISCLTWNLTLVSSNLFWSFCTSDCFNKPFSALTWAVIKSSVFFTDCLISETNPRLNVLETISAWLVSPEAASTASSKEATSLSPIDDTASRINPNSSFISAASFFAFPSPIAIEVFYYKY